ncbi:MAG: hypothetical protein M3Q69_13715 [Acidobacteriota bacterium]|nr:hypothetical protein [Acidobacteriota bacterium]
MIWREKRVLLIILGILLLANTMFFFTYRVRYQSRLDDLDARLDTAEQELKKARGDRMTAERQLQGYRKVESDVAEVFNNHWSTQPKRFTLLISEVKRLAEASNLQPKQYSFVQAEVKDRTATGGRPREKVGAMEVGMSFSVQGTYQQIRRFINLLELSRQFVIIDQIGLTSGENQALTMTLHLKTLFRDDEQQSAAANRL